MEITKYVVGLMFDQSGTRVVLMRKTHPEWQAGRLNGIGGKIEPGETAVQAMIREFEEEAGVWTEAADWRSICILRGTDFSCEVFAGNNDSCYGLAKTMTPEEIVKIATPGFRSMGVKMVSNLPWLISLALDESKPLSVVAHYGVTEEASIADEIVVCKHCGYHVGAHGHPNLHCPTGKEAPSARFGDTQFKRFVVHPAGRELETGVPS